MLSSDPRILVVGSLNVDRIASVARLPVPGETVPALSMIQEFGGKGANQAIAAARQKAAVSMIGCVGDDDLGASYREHLREQGIDDTGVSTLNDEFTGTAMIAVDEAGENQIIVCAGANGRMEPHHVNGAIVAASHVILLQWEVPQPAVLETLRLAEIHGVPAVMNPSPFRADFPWGEHPVHTLIVNEGEAAAVFGRSDEDGIAALQAAMAAYDISHLIITRGATSTLGILPASHVIVPTLSVIPIDTVGAGDAFAGAYAACLARGMEFPDAIRHANFAGALATLKRGAQTAIPHLEETVNALHDPTGAVTVSIVM